MVQNLSWQVSERQPLNQRNWNSDGDSQDILEFVPITKEILDKASLHHSLHSTCRQEEEFWRQKSQSLWLKVGDRNTIYFQKHVEARKQFKAVQEFQDQGPVITRFDKIKEEATRHFNSIYTEDCTIHPREISD